MSDGGGCIIRYVVVGRTYNMFVSLKVFELRANTVCLTWFFDRWNWRALPTFLMKQRGRT